MYKYLEKLINKANKAMGKEKDSGAKLTTK